MISNLTFSDIRVRWRYNLISYYGNLQLRIPDFLTKIRHLRLPNKRLNVVNVAKFQCLEVLELSGNFFRTVDGLEHLIRYSIIIDQ